jgi:hypothetical protein
MPPVPTPPVGSLSPSQQEWTHHPILNYPPEQDQNPLCTNFLLADSLTLDWHPIFNAAPEQAEQLPRVRKDWTANLTLDWHTIFNSASLLRTREDWTANPLTQPDNQGANPMLSNDDSITLLEEEVN